MAHANNSYPDEYRFGFVPLIQNFTMDIEHSTPLNNLSPFAVAQWDTGVNGDWNDPGNWNPAGVPLPADDVIISGAGSIANKANSLQVNGSLSIEDEAQLNTTSTVNIASSVGSVGNVSVDGTGSVWTASGAGQFQLGSMGEGSLFITNGGRLNTSKAVFVGAFPNSKGYALISGPGSMWIQTFNAFQIGNSAGDTSIVEITNGGFLSTISSRIGAFNGNGRVYVDGATSSWSNQNDIIMSLSVTGTSELIIQNGGTVSTTRLIGGAGTKLVTVNNGTLSANGSVDNFISNFSSGEFNIINNFTLDSNGFNIGLIDTVISGAGNLLKTGLGRLTINDDQTYTGDTFVTNGILQLNGSLASTNTTVLTNGTLEGAGRLGGNLSVDGTIAPGNSIGNLTVNGSFVQNSGSTYVVDINAIGQSDKILIDGSALIQSSSNLLIVPESGIYTPGMSYTILTAQSGVNGIYENINQPLSPFLSFVVTQDMQNIFLNIILIPTTGLTSIAITPNQLATASALQNLGIYNPLFDAVLSLPTISQARDALNQLSGVAYSSSLSAMTEDSRFIKEAILNRLYSSSGVIKKAVNMTSLAALNHTDSDRAVWVQGVGDWGKLKGNINSFSATRSIKGLFLGIDKRIADNLILGLVSGYSNSSFNSNEVFSNANIDNYSVAIYAGTALNQWAINLGAVQTWHNVDFNRTIQLSNLYNQLNSTYDPTSQQIFGELGYHISPTSVDIYPFARATYFNINSIDFSEQGGIAALRGKMGYHNLFSALGIRESKTIAFLEHFNLDESIMLYWNHAYNPVTPSSTLFFASGTSPFFIAGAPIAKDALLIDAGINTKFHKKNINIRLAYMGQFAKQTYDNGVTGTINWMLE